MTRQKLAGEALRFVVYGVLFALLVWAVAPFLGYVLSWQPRLGLTGETSPVKLGEAPEDGLLANDFPPEAEVRNVILLIADGLGISQITAARSELGGLGRRLSFERMPITGLLMTHDAGSIITDSAASASAMATGFKTLGGRLGLDAEERPVETVAEAARDRGLALGLVTDSYLWDATPAAFVTHVTSRRNFPEVAAQMARSQAEVLLGEISWGAAAEGDDGPRAMLAGFPDNGYTVARNEVQLAGLPDSGKIAGLFDPGSIADAEQGPSLEHLAEIALERLSRDPEGFFLLVETEETDTASHRQEFRRMVRGVEVLDALATRALDFARRDGSTLVLVTADHETGGLALISGDYGQKLGLRWTTGNHGGGVVPIFAYGPGAERFSGTRDNTEVAEILFDLLGLSEGPAAAEAPASPPEE